MSTTSVAPEILILGHKCTCTEHRLLKAKSGDYWVSYGGILQRIDTLAQDMNYKVVNNAVKMVAPTNEVKWIRWVLAGDDRVCAICIQKSKGGRNGYYKVNWFMPELPHPRCVLEGTLVQTSKGLVPIENVQVGDYVLTHKNRYRKVTYTHKNPYSGKIFEVLGNWLTGNHPVLTPNGWRRADSLYVGEKVCVSAFGHKRYVAISNSEPDGFPAVSTKHNCLVSVMNKLAFRIMPVAPVNFDSQFKFGNRKIQVIFFEGKLWNNVKVMRFKGIKKALFQKRHLISFLPSFSLPHLLRKHNLPSSGCFMGSFDLSASLLRSHLRPLQKLSFFRASRSNSTIYKSVSDNSAGNIVTLCKSILRSARQVRFDNLFNRQINVHLPTRLVYGSFKWHTHTLTPASDISIRTYNGFVRNLTVDEDETYTVGKAGLIVHNCRCERELVFFDPFA